MAPSAAPPDSGIVHISIRFSATDQFLASRRVISGKFFATRSLEITSDPGVSEKGLKASGWLEVTRKFMESTAIDATKIYSTRDFEPTQFIEVSSEPNRSFAFNVSLHFTSSSIANVSSSFGGTQNVISAVFARTLSQDPSTLDVSANYADTSDLPTSRQFAMSDLHQSIVFHASKNLTASNFGVDEAGAESRGFITESFIAAIAAGLVCLLLTALIILYIRRKHQNAQSEQEMAYETEAKAMDLTENDSDDLSHDESSIDDFDRAIESAFRGKAPNSDELFPSDCDEIF
jgi:hypothetical protein